MSVSVTAQCCFSCRQSVTSNWLVASGISLEVLLLPGYLLNSLFVGSRIRPQRKNANVSSLLPTSSLKLAPTPPECFHLRSTDLLHVSFGPLHAPCWSPVRATLGSDVNGILQTESNCETGLYAGPS